ncbi:MULTISPECIES: DoxX family protein [Methylobacterium]|uniref:DoxX family protein n=1 Tax=Methylobacterium jeotgali TaxID=381630 RepID=A0ABQ4SVP2_9HYPH|nr:MULTISPECIES: DoxX family protein [Methylobacterium]PIU04856.1 MAG: DoxX family protein [Methylobacterium sp. CG09_land_8_20_14_0_10_71_15]PIU16068.1 MAG: DoxX family protein [Methylobacterium sp. CG08_land_8_20_14_0_20_71_15]GBU18694.1 hypothetical protein AwMethylo_29090 [Methylobacterium sp.]GJE05973.1 hypothetical protein AOPFMNJM_1279 [Methylobacterium jeotgali]
MNGRVQDATLLVARLALAAALLPTGIARALNVSGFALTLASAAIPFPNAVATLAVMIQVFGPLCVLAGVMPRASGLALAAFALAMAPVLHPFWQYGGAAIVTERALFLADLGLAGGFLVYALMGPGAWSWQGWRRGAVAPRKAAPAARKRSGGRAPARAAA